MTRHARRAHNQDHIISQTQEKTSVEVFFIFTLFLQLTPADCLSVCCLHDAPNRLSCIALLPGLAKRELVHPSIPDMHLSLTCAISQLPHKQKKRTTAQTSPYGCSPCGRSRRSACAQGRPPPQTSAYKHHMSPGIKPWVNKQPVCLKTNTNPQTWLGVQPFRKDRSGCFDLSQNGFRMTMDNVPPHRTSLGGEAYFGMQGNVPVPSHRTQLESH